MAQVGRNNRADSPRSFSVPVDGEAEAVWQPSRTDVRTAERWVEPEGELALDVYVTPGAVVVRTAVAGVRPEDLSVALHNDLLTIRGRRFEEESSGRYIVQECHWGPFSRSVVLPVPVEARGAEAVLRNGILKVVLPLVTPTAVEVRLDQVLYE